MSWRSGVAFLLVALLSGCDRKPTGPEPADVAGSYALNSVNGRLPETVHENQWDRLTIVGGSLTLAEAGRYEWTLDSRRFDKATGATSPETYPDDGSYTVAGRTITFTPTNRNALQYTGTLEGRALSFTITTHFAAAPISLRFEP